MNKKDSGVRWLDVPVFIVDEGINRVDIVTNSRDDLDNPVFMVDEGLFAEIQRDFEPHRVQLEYMLRQFKRGKIDPLNEAARIEDAKRASS